jgi:hypothetical protein
LATEGNCDNGDDCDNGHVIDDGVDDHDNGVCGDDCDINYGDYHSDDCGSNGGGQ